MHVAWLWLGSNRIKEAWRLAPWTAPGRRRKLRNGGTAPVALGRTSRCRGGGAASLSLDEPLVTLVYARRHRENRQTDRHLICENRIGDDKDRTVRPYLILSCL